MVKEVNPLRGVAPATPVGPFVGRMIVTGPAAAWVIATGEVDAGSAPALEACLTTAAAGADVREVFVDLAGVSFIDCSGLSALLATARRLARGNCGLVICDPSAATRRLFGLTGAERMLDVEDGVGWAGMRRGA